MALSNNAPLIEILLGQALVATENKAYTEEAITILRNAMARETEQPLGYTQLAMAYARKGDLAEADLASAQAAFLRGDNKTARDLASRAKTRFAVGTPGWVKADDIVVGKAAGRKERQLAPISVSSRSPGSNRSSGSRSRPGPGREPVTNATQQDPVQKETPMSPLRPAPSCPFRAGDRRRTVSCLGAKLLRWPTRRDRDHHQELPRQPSGGAGRSHGRIEQAPGRGRRRKAPSKRSAEFEAIFNSPRNVTLGNKNGDVTFVEFFDYNCGYCKRAMSDMLDLMKSDPKLKVVLKEFPVLSEGSVEAAKVAVAVRMQDPGGEQISRLPPEAARRPRPRRQGTRARCRQGRGARCRPYREGYDEPRGRAPPSRRTSSSLKQWA